MKWLALTRVFRLGSILKVAVPAALALMAGAFWAGQQWQSGRTAQAELRVVQSGQAEAARTQAHQHQVSADYEQRRAERQAASRVADAELAAWLADRADLWGCDIGPDGLRLIRSWNTPSAGEHPGESTDPVSDAAARPGHRPGSGPAREHEGPD